MYEKYMKNEGKNWKDSWHIPEIFKCVVLGLSSLLQNYLCIICVKLLR